MQKVGKRAQDPVMGEALVLRHLAERTQATRSAALSHYGPLIERIARKYSGMEPVEDLTQVGSIGLLNALEKFDPAANVKFSTYATYLVTGEIKHYLRDRSQTIRHPAWLQELRQRVNRATNLLQQSLGRNPSAAEIAAHIDVPEATVKEVLATQDTLRVSSLDATIGSDEDSDTELEKLDAADFCADQLTVEDRVVLEQALRQLRDLEREVLVLFHFHSMKQGEIAEHLGISANYVTHILRQSLTKLRKIFAAEGEQDRVLRRQASVLSYEVIDPSTGAYTEGFFHTRLKEEVHRASSDESAVGVVLIDFVGLQSLQSFYGADSVLDFLADATSFVRNNTRRLDLVCRRGAHGLGVILPSTGHNTVVAKDRLVARLTDWLLSRFQSNGTIQVEIGHASFPEDGRSVSSILTAASVKPVFYKAA